jgi:DNA-binding beta-propeller fold protein YncE
MTRKAVLTFVFLFALTGIFSYAQQGLKPSASLTLSGEIVGLASCAGGSALVAANKSAAGTTLQVINTFSKEIVASASVAIANPSALAVNRDCATAFVADASANKVFVVSPCPAAPCAPRSPWGRGPSRSLAPPITPISTL